MIYLDSSALVKRYVEEKGSDAVDFLLRAELPAAVSKLAYPEILSGFARKYRSREISKKDFDSLAERFETDWQHFVIVEFHDELLSRIKTLIRKHYLRGADSIHLSAALWLRDAVKKDITFVASDNALLEAADKEGLEIINPEQ